MLAAGTNKYENLDEFGSRAKPGAGAFTAGEFQESIVLTLRAYTDAGYTNLKWTYQRTVTIVWVKSDDAAFTVDELDNFDDGTVQGWAYTVEVGNTTNSSFGAASDYVLSPLYSLRAKTGDACAENLFRVSKTFNTPNKPKIYMIANIRLGFIPGVSPGTPYTKNFKVQLDSSILVFLGRPYDTVTADYIPKDKWLRAVIPLPANQAIDVRLVYHAYSACFRTHPTLWLDDFKIISK